MISRKTQYALVAMRNLAQNYGKGAVMISEIARQESIPGRFLENILQELKRTGWLGSKLGKNGGYFLLKEPHQINMAEVVRQFEGTIALLYCVSERQYQPCNMCHNEEICSIRKVFKDIRDYSYQRLEQTSLLDLLEIHPVLEPEYQI